MPEVTLYTKPGADDQFQEDATLEADVAAVVGTSGPLDEALGAEYAARRLAIADAEIRVSDIDSQRLGTLATTTWTTPDASGVVVHPSVVFVPEGFGGYHWWAAMTPYTGTDNQVENPCVMVSTDGNTWVDAPGVTNPLVMAPASGYNSDPELVLGPDRTWYLMYREFHAITPKERLRVFTSTDGATWSGPTTVMSTNEATARFVSPTFWYDPNAEHWVMLAVDIIPSGKPITRFTADTPLGPWTNQGTVTYTPSLTDSHKPWHIEARWMSGQVVVLMQTATTDGGTGRLYYGVSGDAGANITFQSTAIAPLGCYRSTFVPMIDGRGLAFDTFVGKAGPSNTWWIERATVRYGLSPADQHAYELSQAVNLPGTYIFADAFTRTAASLGTSTSGLTWTSSAGTWKTNGKEAYLDAASNSRSYVELGVANATVKALMSGLEANQTWLVLRLSDANNYVRVGSSSGSFYFDTIESGGVVTHTLLSSVGLPSGSHEIAVTMSGTTYTIYLDGFNVATVTNSFNSSATKAGIQAQNTSSRVHSMFALT